MWEKVKKGAKIAVPLAAILAGNHLYNKYNAHSVRKARAASMARNGIEMRDVAAFE